MVTALLNQTSLFPPGITMPTAAAPAAGAPAPGAATPAAPAASLPGAAAKGNSSQMIEQVVGMITLLLVSMIQEMMGGSAASLAAPTPGPTAAPPPAPLPAAAPAAPVGAPAPAAPTGKPVIVQLDDFATNAGDVNADILGSGGATVKKINVNTGGNRTAAIADNLEKLVAAARAGERIDVVNLQQQNFTQSADTQRAAAAIEQLSAMGIPVVVSAGLAETPNTQGVKNQFTTLSSFNVQAIDNLGGLTALNGNIRQSGTHAPARISVQIAALRAQGLSLAEIRQRLGVA